MDIVLPCLNEAAALPWVLERIPAGMRAIVVDNGSSDGSAELARARGALVVECRQRGYGAACHAGAQAATAELIAFCDCDATVDPGVIVAMARLDAHRAGGSGGGPPPADHPAGLAAARPAGQSGAGPAGAPAYRHPQLSDIGPVRVADREPYLALGLTDRASGYPVETVVRAAGAGWRIVQSDVAYLPRTGRSKVTGTLRGTLGAVRDMSAVLSR